MKNRNLFLTVCFMAITAISFAQTQKATNLLVGDTSGSVEATAELEVESTTKGFLPPRMTNAQMGAIGSPAEGLIVYCTNCSPKGIYVSNGAGFATLTGQVDQTGLAAGEVRSSTGAIWQDKNLGATQVATSSTDVDSFGGLYQWGRATDGHEVRTSAVAAGPVASGSEGADFISTGAANVNWLTVVDNTRWDVGSANNPCSAGYRVPTIAEYQSEIQTLSAQSLQGAFDSPLKFPAAGYRNYNSGTIHGTNIRVIYWSSTFSDDDRAFNFDIGANYTGSVANHPKSYGFSVRCIKE